MWCIAAVAIGGESNDVHFYFVQITDTHVGQSEENERLTSIVQAINRLPMPIAFVIHTGDIVADAITNPATVKTAQTILGGLHAPVHYVPGNHDIRPKDARKTADAFQASFGPLCGKAEYGGVVLLHFYSEPLRRNVSIKGYDPLGWLETALQDAGDRPVVIFTHAPSVDDFYDNRSHPGWHEEARQRWQRLINAHNVKAVIAGHFHRDELHWLSRVPLFVCPPVAGYWHRNATFRVYEYRNGQLSYWTQYLE